MTKMKFIVAALFLCLGWVSAQNNRVTLCGRQLAEARALLCFGAENVNKRNSLSNYIPDSLEEPREEWSLSRGLLASWPRYKRQGIADQCCLQSCTQEDILSYC